MLSFNPTYIPALKTRIVADVTTAAKIAAFSDMKVGWHYGSGTQFDPKIIALALRLLPIFYEFNIEKTNAFPGAAGEIMLTGYRDLDYIEVVINPDENISILRERDRVEDFSKDNLDENIAAWQLRELLGDKCTISGYFTPNTLILSETNSRAWPSRTMTAVLPSFNENVWIQHQTLYASTFESFIQTPEVIPPSSGFFLRMQSQRGAR
jgi:hypothetical protein